VTLDPQHRLVEWNPGAENLFGYTRAEVIGRNIDDLITTDETCQEAAAITRRAMAGKRVPSTEAIRHRKDGSPVSVRLAGSPILVGDELIGVVGIYTDISEHKAAEEALSDSQSRLGGILSSMPDLVFAVDEEGRFTFHHSPDSSDPYVSPEALLGKRYTEVLPRHLNERFSRALEKVRRGEAAKFEYSIDIGDKECWFSASLSPIFLEDTFRGAVAVTREITERKRAVEALRSANRGLQMLSECNRVLSRVQDEQELLREVCRIAVEIGGYRLAWVGYARPDQARSVQPMAQAGFEEGYLDTVRISWADTERGRGPTGTAIRTGQPAAAKNVLTDPPFAPWREEATRRGYASSIALPLQVRGSTIGALIVYAARPDAFDSEEVSLLAELADNLAYGITALRAWSERRKAEAALRGYAERLEMLHDVDRAILEAASPEAIAQATLRRIQQIIPCQEATISAFGFEAAKSEVLAVQVADEARGKRPERGEGPGKGRAEGPGKGRAEGPGKGRAEEPPGVVEDKQSLRAARSLRHRSSLIAPLELPAGGVGLPERVTTPSEPAPSSPKARAAGVPMERDPRTQTAPTDMTIPLMAQGELIGTLHLSTEEWPGFSPEHVEMAYELAAPLAVAIQQARLHEQLGRHAGSLEETVSQRTRELKAERDRTQAILESLGEAVVVTDVAGTILYTNPATLSQTGFRSEELIGQRQRIWEGDQASAEAYSRMPDILSAGRTWGGEMVLRRKDGSLFDAAVTMAPLFDPDDTGTLVGSVCVQRDITPLKEAERIKDDFVSNVSHELRTPLSIITLISGNLERLYGHLDDDKRRTMIGSIREYVGLLNDLIGDVLEISRIDSGRVSKEREGVDLARLAGEEVEKQRPLAGRRSQTVTLAGEESLLVDGNEGQLRQVIRNLINNAIKFTPDRGQIACECRLVSSIMEPRTGWPGADALAGGHWAALRVVDTGIGIGPEHLPNLFQRFYRAETEGNIPGTGLGLAITHELVELHGGHITVESIPEEGSGFVIYLPLATEES
jgi:PAS domain S-box-containing protein